MAWVTCPNPFPAVAAAAVAAAEAVSRPAEAPSPPLYPCLTCGCAMRMMWSVSSWVANPCATKLRGFHETGSNQGCGSPPGADTPPAGGRRGRWRSRPAGGPGPGRTHPAVYTVPRWLRSAGCSPALLAARARARTAKRNAVMTLCRQVC
jgi:hypothetical protein